MCPHFKPGFNRDLAVFLAEACVQAYNLFDSPKDFKVPAGYNMSKIFTAQALDVQEIFGFIAESSDSIIVAFKGTDSDSDIIADLEFLQIPFFYVKAGGKTHVGFTLVYISCRDQIIDALKLLSPGKTLYITGHSVGAALATLSTFDIASNTGFKQPVMYNFASPRAGDLTFANTYNNKIKNSERIVNIYDVIPMLPPEQITIPFIERTIYYSHVKDRFPVAAQTGSLKKNHSLKTYIDALNKLAPVKDPIIE